MVALSAWWCAPTNLSPTEAGAFGHRVVDAGRRQRRRTPQPPWGRLLGGGATGNRQPTRAPPSACRPEPARDAATGVAGEILVGMQPQRQDIPLSPVRVDQIKAGSTPTFGQTSFGTTGDTVLRAGLDSVRVRLQPNLPVGLYLGQVKPATRRIRISLRHLPRRPVMGSAAGRRVAVLGGERRPGSPPRGKLSRPGGAIARPDHRVPSVVGSSVAGRRHPRARWPDPSTRSPRVWLGYYDNAFRLMRECYDDWTDRTPIPGLSHPHVARCLHTRRRRSASSSRTKWKRRHLAGPLRHEELVAPAPPPAVTPIWPTSSDGQRLWPATSSGRHRAGIGSGEHRPRPHGHGAARPVGRPIAAPARGVNRQVNNEDLRHWLRRHGAADVTVEGGLVRAMYDLVFAYRGGDRSQPAFPAELSVPRHPHVPRLQGSALLEVAAGMGDTVYAPLHQALTRRGVDIRYFHRVDGLRPSPTMVAGWRTQVVQQIPAEVASAYEPLRPVGGIPCFPHQPGDRRRAGPRSGDADRAPTPVRRRRCDGASPWGRSSTTWCSPSLLERSARSPRTSWNAMGAGRRCIGRLVEEHRSHLGGPGLAPPRRGDPRVAAPRRHHRRSRRQLRPYASMSHLIEVEDWPEGDEPTPAYLPGAR